MYQDFFGLKEPPFNLTPDPRFLYMSRRHREALASLVYGIKEGKGFIALTGEIGSGKTTLCRAFLAELNSETTHVALILNSYLSDLELLQAINDELGLPSDSDSKKELIDRLNKFLLEENAKGKTTVLIVDESQNLGIETLEQIRMLSNLETERAKLIQIVLIGQPELAGLLARPELEQLNQRIMVRCHIGPLGRDEIYNYVRHRLHVAGADINIGMAPAAINRIYHFSGGVPRKINLLCDRAMLVAYAAGKLEIDAQIVARAQRDVAGMPDSGQGPGRVFEQPATRVGRVVGGAITLALLLAGLFYAGLRLSGPSASSNPDVADAAPAPTSTVPKAAQRRPPAEPLSAVVPPPVAIQGGPVDGADWEYDANRVVRVGDPAYAQTACFLTLAQRWGFDAPLEDFRGRPRDEILELDILKIFNEKVDLRTYTSRDPIETFLPVDMPLALKIDAGDSQLSPWVTLESIADGTCRVSDPRLGILELSLEDLQAIAETVTLVYLDPDGLALLSPGKRSELVERVQKFLIERDCAEPPPQALFDVKMVGALERFQDKRGLPKTGRLDGRTAAIVSAAWRDGAHPRIVPPSPQNPADAGH